MPGRVSFGEDVVCRVARDDSRDVMEHFSSHCSRCRQCSDPYRAYLKDTTLCDRGHAYARDVGQYIYSKAGKAFSRVDREERGDFNQVAIPAGCEAVKSLLKAVDQGLKVRTSPRPVVVQPVKPVRERERSKERAYVPERRSRSPVEREYLRPVRTRDEVRRRSTVYIPGRGSLYEKDEEERRRRKLREEERPVVVYENLRAGRRDKERERERYYEERYHR